MNTLHIIAMAPQPQGQGGGGMISTIVLFGLIAFIFYFMILRPQQKRQKERQKLLDGIKKGDKVTTVGGMHATVIGLEEKTVLLQAADNVKLKYDRTAIQVITHESEPEAKTN